MKRFSRSAANGGSAVEASSAIALASAVALLDSGANPDKAWAHAGVPLSQDGLPQLPEPMDQAAIQATYELCRSSGIPLAPVLAAVADLAQQRADADDAINAALASPLAGARILYGLPLVGLALAAIVEPRSAALIFGSSVGAVLVTVAATLYYAGYLWIRRAVKKVRVLAQGDHGVGYVAPLSLSLLEGAFAAGLDPLRALSGLSAALQQNWPSVTAQIDHAVSAICTGESWQQAWREQPVGLQTQRQHRARMGSRVEYESGADYLAAHINRALSATWHMGASPRPLLRATRLRILQQTRSRTVSAANALGSRLALPMALCFLPAFMALGIAPLIITTMRQAF